MEAQNTNPVTSNFSFIRANEQTTKEGGVQYSGKVHMGARTIHVTVMVSANKLAELKQSGKLDEAVQKTALKTAQAFIVAEAKHSDVEKVTLKGEKAAVHLKGGAHHVEDLKELALKSLNPKQAKLTEKAIIAHQCAHEILFGKPAIGTYVEPELVEQPLDELLGTAEPEKPREKLVLEEFTKERYKASTEYRKPLPDIPQAKSKSQPTQKDSEPPPPPPRDDLRTPPPVPPRADSYPSREADRIPEQKNEAPSEKPAKQTDSDLLNKLNAIRQANVSSEEDTEDMEIEIVEEKQEEKIEDRAKVNPQESQQEEVDLRNLFSRVMKQKRVIEETPAPPPDKMDIEEDWK